MTPVAKPIDYCIFILTRIHLKEGKITSSLIALAVLKFAA